MEKDTHHTSIIKKLSKTFGSMNYFSYICITNGERYQNTATQKVFQIMFGSINYFSYICETNHQEVP